MSSIHRTSAWAALCRKVRPILQSQIDSGQAVCLDCMGFIMPGEKWDVGHRLDAGRWPTLAFEEWNLGPSHRRCNRKAGGTLGANKTNAQRKRKTEGQDYFKW